MATEQQKFFFEAADAYFGTPHCRLITTVADSGGSLAGTYFELNGIQPAATASDEYFSEFLGYIYTGTDPALSGRTGLEYTIANDATAEEVAQAIQTAIEGDVTFDALFSVSVSGAVITLENKYEGAITAEADGGSGFTFKVANEGLGTFLGRTADAIEVAFTTNAEVVNTNQGAANKEDEIYTGSDVTATLNLVEVTTPLIESIFSAAIGDKVTVGSADIVGVGEARLFESLAARKGRLYLHPRRLDNNDKSKDLCFVRSAPKPQTLNFDGTALQQLSVQFDGYLDRNVDERYNLYIIGDWDEALNA